MSIDYKYAAQLRAEELAMDEFGPDVDFYDLSPEQRDRLYGQGLESVFERLIGEADDRRDL